MASGLRGSNLSLKYGGVSALCGLSMDLAPGEVIGLIGPNGSGKTSFLNLVTGFESPTEGAIFFEGQELTGKSAQSIARKGIARTFQNLQVFSRLSVYENMRAGCHRCSKPSSSFWQFKAARNAEKERILSLLDCFSLADMALDTPEALTLVQLRQLDLARALASEPKLILLDEPAAGMTPYETDQLAKTLQDHVLNGRSAIIIEHKIDFIAALARRTFVLSAGRAIADGPTDEVLCNKDVRRIYLGECG